MRIGIKFGTRNKRPVRRKVSRQAARVTLLQCHQKMLTIPGNNQQTHMVNRCITLQHVNRKYYGSTECSLGT